MNRKICATVVILLALACSASASATSKYPPGFWTHPAIQSFGSVHLWPSAELRPDAKKIYKAVFSIEHDKSSLKLNHGLGQVARTINAFGSTGVPLNHLRFVVVLSGKATPIALNNKTFEAKFKHPNPNQKIIAELQKAGVRLFVCGNALAGWGFNPTQLSPNFKVAVSAVSTEVMLQNEGYALMQ